ncbi:M1 family aminopeptidase [Pedobacter nototheniae]|uniref:M1 family aminopeptidase n=1 Tax=Pedobacter nototheniae TaxID=2488994 RepID=UPI002930BF2E|nr:M1 family aminopeptidase [Pedobacter nototheniae]
MNLIYSFELKQYSKGFFSYFSIVFLLSIGFFAGNQFNLAIGEGVFLNAPYTVGFMIGLLSLSIIFIATFFASQLLFKEWDSRFDSIVFATPIPKKSFASGRLLSLVTLTFLGFLCLMAGFTFGQNMRSGVEINPDFRPVHYLYPVIIFGFINTLFVCSVLGLVAYSTRNKLLVAVTGLMLYVLYMITLLFSNSPFMAQSMPQSMQAQLISAVADPFGISAYFTESQNFSIQQRNIMLVPLSGYFLFNRFLVLLISLVFFAVNIRIFSFTKKEGRKKDVKYASSDEIKTYQSSGFSYLIVNTKEDGKAFLKAVFSFIKIDLTYLFKSTVLILTAIVLLFAVGMEMYAEIEKGIRLPQKYASSGLMATTIIENFHVLGLLLVAYFLNDMFWRSSASKFNMIENATLFSKSKWLGHWIGISILLVLFSLLLIGLGIVFQVGYQYPYFDLKAYGGVFVFNTSPFILFSGFILFINQLIKNKYAALGISILLAVSVSGALSKKLIAYPLLRFFSGFNGTYSDFNGYGIYLPSFAFRLLFGFSIIGLAWIIFFILKNKRIKLQTLVASCIWIGLAFFSGKMYMRGYIPVNKNKNLESAANYEKQYRIYQNLAQPTITDVETKIDLYPSKESYSIAGKYIIKNLSNTAIDKILINFDEHFKINNATYSSEKERINFDKSISVLQLIHPLQPNDTAHITFKMAYQWEAVNGHQSFNAIIENGSFMRISRYFPQVGYQSGNELQDEEERKIFSLGKQTPLKKINAPKIPDNDFIKLDMTVSTEGNQTAVGTGELVRQWKQGSRNYFQYKPNQPVPFRFAISSAAYAMKTTMYKGVQINICYHPKHAENVQHLLNNIKLTLDYCQDNFGIYPFRTITFAEVSSFTKGFAATAYPAVIFMTEDLIFHANIKADKQQDVINELAGHELSHLWWGNNQIAPDDREGAVMLTETLAMYTEMMLYKKMHGKEKMMERVKMHEQIYNSEKGFTENQPLYKVTGNNTHISYSKGAMVMVKLSDLIGEQKVNEALRNFLAENKYPNLKPISTDLIAAFFKVSDQKYHKEIRELFMEKN